MLSEVHANAVRIDLAPEPRSAEGLTPREERTAQLLAELLHAVRAKRQAARAEAEPLPRRVG